MNPKEGIYKTIEGCIYDLKEYSLNLDDISLLKKCQKCIDCLNQFIKSSKINDINKIQYEGELYRKSDKRAGYDIVQHEDIFIPPRQIIKIKTNVRFPDGINDNFALVTLRSSYQDSGLLMPSTGILDSNYTDYLFITVFNSTYQAIKINKGDRLAQLIFIKNNDIKLVRSD